MKTRAILINVWKATARHSRIAILIVPLSAGLVFGLSTSLGQEGFKEDPNKKPKDPYAGITDEERRALISATWSAAANWVRDFQEKGGDPRSLPVENIEAFGLPVSAVSEALSQSDFAVEGRVLETRYEVDSTGMTFSIATLQVSTVSKGTIEKDTIEVFQLGGPTMSPSGGVLQQMDLDPVLLKDDHVILLLTPALADEHRAADRFQTIARAGIYAITPAGVQAQPGNMFAASVNGRSVDEVLELFK
jgi:hypothetical protein